MRPESQAPAVSQIQSSSRTAASTRDVAEALPGGETLPTPPPEPFGNASDRLGNVVNAAIISQAVNGSPILVNPTEGGTKGTAGTIASQELEGRDSTSDQGVSMVAPVPSASVLGAVPSTEALASSTGLVHETDPLAPPNPAVDTLPVPAPGIPESLRLVDGNGLATTTTTVGVSPAPVPEPNPLCLPTLLAMALVFRRGRDHRLGVRGPRDHERG
jgi:hypothetical protein